jgi:glycosyltransferase involved in cell wall biosynthesis
MKIALVGPAYPYRGGIAHHTNMLYRTLRALGHEVDVITFTRQYPKILFPGKSQDEIGVEGEGIPSERMIDSLNPFNWIVVGRRLRKRNYDLIVFKFWLPFFAPAFGTIARLAHRKGRNDIMIVVDNFRPHERRPGDILLTKYLFRYCNTAITQSSEVERQLREAYPSLPHVMLPHPTYENFGDPIPRDDARARLGIVAPKVLLFFGFVRRYKGLDRLLAAMPEIVRRVPDAHLLVVGEFYESAEPYLEQIRSGGVGERITIHDRYVSNEEVALWFSAADMLVLPYHHATNSGIAMIGYNFAVPAIVTNVGSLGEVVIDGLTGFVLDDASPDAIASAVERMYEGDTRERFSEAIIEERKKYSWERFAQGMVDLALAENRG